MVKGFVDRDGWPAAGDSGPSTSALQVRSADTGTTESINLAEAKAVFFVREFDGVFGHTDLRFHDHLPPPECLWIRLVFRDGEVLEGMIENGGRYVLDPGFLVTPTDPTANNWLIYVPKGQVRNFEVLGLRQRTPTKLAQVHAAPA